MADSWYALSNSGTAFTRSWRSLWAVTRHERLRLRAAIDAVVAALFDIDLAALKWILRDCDHPRTVIRGRDFTRSLDAKGFWRIDSEEDVELRHPVLAMAAFMDLQDCITACGGDRKRGIEQFCTQNRGDGWMVPETLCLADLDLGHDQRAQNPQPVRDRLGDRFLPWQLEESAEESWAECEQHARTLLGAVEFTRLQADLAQARGSGGVATELVAADPRPPYGFGLDPLLPEAAAAEQGRLEL
jgi:hypothetical protein